ncbi:MAG: TetR/AcrR family transcriptional regulator [Hyphomicrobiaceae bacterium]|nr:TetR/AcrR family transcriptional regulator [Hyphomicrobiaceae bacterium]
MPKLKPDIQLARRVHILDAAERAFAAGGFHRTTMQDIAREASVSLGALYVYFASKEDLIAGITERDRAKLAGELADVAQAPDIAVALAKLGEHYTVDEPRHKQQLVIEIGCEAMRGGAVGAIYRAADEAILGDFERLFQRAIEDGRIRPRHDSKTLARAVAVLGDGLFWRRAVDPTFDTKAMVPVIAQLVTTLLEGDRRPEPEMPEVQVHEV